MTNLTDYRLHFPRDLTADGVLGVLLALNSTGAVHAPLLRLAVRGTAGRLDHRLATAESRPDLARQLPLMLPGVRLEDVSSEGEPAVATYVWQLRQSTSRRPLRTDHPELTTRAILTALLAVRGAEWLELRWLLGPVQRANSVSSKHAPVMSESWSRALSTAAFHGPRELDAEARQALRTKHGEPAWRLLGQLVVGGTMNERRAQDLAAGLAAAIRTSEGPGVRFGVRRSSPRHLDRSPWRWPLQVNAVELVGLLSWPLDGAAQGLPVNVQRARQLEPRHAQPRSGHLIGHSPSGRPVRLSGDDSLRHLLITGPTGTGKSTVMLQLVLQDIAAGNSVILLDPKGDLVDEVLVRYPAKRLDDLVVIDPRDEAPVGVNPLYRPRHPALVADQLLGIFTQLFKDSFGPRTADVLGASLLTLARWGEGSLAVLPLLLTHPALRRRIVGAVPDPLGTGPFWAWYERLKDAERQQIIAPSLNKLRPFTVRPDLRAVLGQVQPAFALGDLVRGRRVVLVNLAKGALGPESSALFGTVLLNQLWQTLQGRGELPPNQRRRIGIYVDEIADYLRLPGDVGELLIQARSLGIGFTLAHQHLGQLPTELRAAVLANARSRVLFQLASDDARVFAAGHPELDPTDLMGLGPFEAYAGLLQDNQVQPYVSLRTAPPGPVEQDGADLRRRSQERYGRSRSETDAALQALVDPVVGETDAVGRRPRRSA